MIHVRSFFARICGFPSNQPISEQQAEMTSFIPAEIDQSVQLSPSDHYCNTFACIPWVMFYTYDISGEKLKTALHSIARAYPVLCGRLVSDPVLRMKLEVKSGTGFRFTEATSECTLLEGIMAARVKDQSAAFPNFAELPFMMAELNSFATLDQPEAPVFSVKLTHFSDGASAVAGTIHHSVADAQRLAELMEDVSRAYRGETLRLIDHDRTKLWPDQLVQKIQLGLSPDDFPRKIEQKFDVLPLPSFPEETYSIESIYIPKSSIEDAKKKVQGRLRGDVTYISQVDVVNAALWMLRCELEAIRENTSKPIKTATDLGISESLFLFFIDLVSNDKTILDKSFFGNGFFGTLTQYPKAESDEQKGYDLLDTLVEASMAVRRHVLAMRSPQAHAMNMIGIYKGLSDPIQYPPFIGGLSSFYKMPFDQMDFGQGVAVYNYGLPSYPFLHVWGCICPTDGDHGMVINTVIRKKDRENTINSTVFKELFPGTKLVADMKSIEVSKILSLTDSEA